MQWGLHTLTNLSPLASMQDAVVARAGAARSVTCRALGEGASLVQVSRELLMAFVANKPRTLQIYLHKVPTGMLWASSLLCQNVCRCHLSAEPAI